MEYVRPIEEVKPFYNFLMGWQEGEQKKWYCGIEGVTFIWHGDWSDPELGYNGYAINEPTATDGLYAIFHDETGKDDTDSFAEWLKGNKELFFETLDSLIAEHEKEGNVNEKTLQHD